MKNETKNDALFTLIKTMVETPGPSGQEHLMREAIKAEIKGYCDEVVTDALGNLIARKGKKSDEGRRIMISAHMDEIGVMVTHIDDNAFVRFLAIGGISPLTCIGGRVLFMNGVSGVIGVERLEPNTMPKLENLFIDTGASSAKDSPVAVGDVAGFYRPAVQLGNRLVAKSMDDRIAVVIAIEAMKAVKSSPNELYFVFSVQEEVGIRGAATAAFGVDPDLGLAVDVTRTGDTPKSNKMTVALGNGPAIKVRDSSFIADKRIVEWMVDEAKAQKLPYQMEVLEAGGTDGRAIQMTRAGVPAGCLSIPCRYIHSPSEMVDRGDVENSIKLLTGLLSKEVTF